MSEYKKVGILGGTFDPIHLGHLIIANQARTQFDLTTVLIMPTNEPPHKENQVITPASRRNKMVQLAIEDNKHFKLSTIEQERKGTTYTSDTLTQLCENNPNCRYYFILGYDSLAYIDSWHRPDYIFNSAVILVALRNNEDIETVQQQISFLEDKYNGEIHLLNIPNINVSSEFIRNRVIEKESISYFVPKDVEKYIYVNSLYRLEENK
ncbi:MAG: nicotinate-nucleotide adenylyltransferase [Clostridiales bacterium]|nr:nicotinate-nucleotide adenylyltransferase [Clostridiales bacterium]